MKFKTLSGREVRIQVSPSNFPLRTREACRSNGQYILGTLLQSIYGNHCLILEEFSIPETKLAIDFYLPHHGLAFEFQGQQHDSFNAHFHIDKDGFNKQRNRDERKKNWCKINSINLIEIRQSELEIEALKSKIIISRESI
jgi:hypothetical protein